MENAHKVSFIELHDARVQSVTVAHEGRVLIDFSYLPVYISEESGGSRERLWSYRGEVELQQVSKFSSDLVLERDNWVVDGRVVLSDGTEADLADFAAATASCRGFVLEFASGAIVKVDCRVALVRLGDGSPTDEVWIDGEPQRRTVV